ncbi:MAG: zinc-dependent alcohol dehydrogenase [Chloroflexota bacterium]
MQAVVKYARGVGNVALRDIPEPEAGPGQVKIEVKAVGVCGTDLHIFHDEYPSDPPVALGHELAGVVVARGDGVTDFAVGDRVTTRTFFVTCGKCQYCRTGRDNLCYSRKSIGSGVHGAMAKYLVVPEHGVLRLPDNVSFLAGALSEPLACNVHAVLETNRPQPGERVLVTGPGAIGLLAMQLVKVSGAHVTMLGTPSDAPRLELAKRLGADDIVLTSDLEAIFARERQAGYDSVIECSGAPGGIEAALQLVRRGGRYTQVGLVGKKVSIDIDQLVYKEVEFSATFAHVWTAWPRGLQLLAEGKVRTEPLVSHRFPLARWEEAFKTFSSRDGVKVVLEP